MFNPEKDCAYAEGGKCFVMSSELLQELAITNPYIQVCTDLRSCESRNETKFYADDESGERIPITITEYFSLPDDGSLPQHDFDTEIRNLDEK